MSLFIRLIVSQNKIKFYAENYIGCSNLPSGLNT